MNARQALLELLEAVEAPYPAIEEGEESKSAWATRQKLARAGARDVLAKEDEQEGGEPVEGRP